MSTLSHISGLSQIADRYDALFCDAWGVIHDGVNLFDGVAEALMRFRAERGPVIILTNAPRPGAVIPAQLDRIGLPRAAYDAVVTSGDATRAMIAAHLPAPAYWLGPEKDEALQDGLAIDFAPIDDADFIICTGMVDDLNHTPDDYASLLTAAAARKLPMICVNPDVVVRLGGRLIYCAGALAELYQRLGGAVVCSGKPHPPIYELAFAAAEAAKGAPVSRNRVLAIGDGLATDIAGANNQRIAVMYIAGAGGVHEGGAAADAIEQALARAGAVADYASTGLHW